MPPTTLALSALLALGTAAGFAAVGAATLRRAAPGARPGATIAFTTFWFSAAIVWGLQGLGSLAGYHADEMEPLIRALGEATVPFYCLAAASLLYYVLYLVTGRGRLLAPILAYYLALYVALRWHSLSTGVVGIEVRAWQVATVHAAPLQGPAYTMIVGLVAVPLLLAIAAYGSLFFRVADPTARYRIGLVTLGLLGWILTEAIAFATGFASTSAGELTRRLAALGGTLVVLSAYLPPRWARDRLGVAAAWPGA